ncbi:phosphatidylinositol mannoside acyltransferase [Cellulomonas palmilytica]|uniref:phosphatidylinositol mannoside acyltransferase n=1 Tax=Cellulomonas palmilytica TaxID=2608402 RepID=UPI001F026B2B|nr:phosphatidylinositol mannoside acyltransferase [Cellulomonas palmilytica]UJP39105.1 phosphatidylinositol mannoside acyltransferase [Cellulomonas palmilytica]
MSLDVGALYAFAWRHAHRVPGAVLRGAANLAADVTWWRHGEGVRRLERNLARVRPELDDAQLRRLSRAAMRSYLRYFAEAFSLSGSSREQIDARVRAVGLDALVAHVGQGRAAVLALGHLGNWDLAGAWATRNIAHVTTVAERLEPPQVFEEFLRFREGIGLTILALGDGDVFRELLRVARAPQAGIIPLLADRDLTHSGVEVDLFGHRARVAAGPAALALASGAPLFATAITYERLHGERRRRAGTPWGLRIDFLPVEPVGADVPRADQVRVLTQAWVDRLAECLHRRPQDWHMLQRVFVEDLDPERYAATRRRAGELDEPAGTARAHDDGAAGAGDREPVEQREAP